MGYRLMKKIMFIAVFFAGFNSFANDIKEDKKDEKVTYACCTDYLSNDGRLVDQETVCGFITQGDNCRLAQQRLLDRHKSVNPSGKI